ncbi:MAG: hypothetical protein IK013_03020 [Bacteroidales bacterium]|nr:hypothetical protein [Bacteroidales bacterium]
MKRHLLLVIVILVMTCNGYVKAQDSYTKEQPQVLFANALGDSTVCYNPSSAFHLQMPSMYNKISKSFSFIIETRLIYNMPYDVGVPREKAIVSPSAFDFGLNFSWGAQIDNQFFIGAGFGFGWHRMKLNYVQYMVDHGYDWEDWYIHYSDDVLNELYSSGVFEYGVNAHNIADYVFNFGIRHKKLRTILDVFADFRWEPNLSSSIIPTVGLKAGFGFGGLFGFTTIHAVFRPSVGVIFKCSDQHKLFLNLEYIPISNFKAHSLGITFGYKFR